jgi:hypothetical protein
MTWFNAAEPFLVAVLGSALPQSAQHDKLISLLNSGSFFESSVKPQIRSERTSESEKEALPHLSSLPIRKLMEYL